MMTRLYSACPACRGNRGHYDTETFGFEVFRHEWIPCPLCAGYGSVRVWDKPKKRRAAR